MHHQQPSQLPRDGSEQHLYSSQDQYHLQQQQHHHARSSESPRESSVGAESDSAAYRPSFKRLASQTLGPPNAKRALLGPAGWDDVQREGREEALEEDDVEDGDTRRFGGHHTSGQRRGSRRFSLPGTTAGSTMTLPPIRTNAAHLGQELAQQQQSPVGAYPQA